MYLIHITSWDFLVVHADDSSRHTDNCTVRWNLFKYYRTSSDLRIFSDCKRTQNLCAGAHHNIIFQRWMTFSLFFSGTAKRNPLIQCYIISDDRSFSDDHTCSMIDKKSLSNCCTRMDLNPCLTRCSLRNPACPEIMLFQVKLMRHSVA